MKDTENKIERLMPYGSSLQTKLRNRVTKFNLLFNSLERCTKNLILVLFGLSMAMACATVTFSGWVSQEFDWMKPDAITTPKDIYPDSVGPTQPTPVAPESRVEKDKEVSN